MLSSPLNAQATLARRHGEPGRAAQTGFTLVGLIFWALILAFGAVIGLRVLPTVNEYHSIKSTVHRIAKNGGGTVAEIRSAFDKAKQTEYSINAISGKDLDVTKENGRVVVSFAYDKEIELFGPVLLLIKYRGTSD